MARKKPSKETENIFISMTDEEGNVVKFLPLARVMYNNELYSVMIPHGEETLWPALFKVETYENNPNMESFVFVDDFELTEKLVNFVRKHYSSH